MAKLKTTPNWHELKLLCLKALQPVHSLVPTGLMIKFPLHLSMKFKKTNSIVAFCAFFRLYIC